jgi:LytR cell envelope-related transcriptional attenuator
MIGTMKQRQNKVVIIIVAVIALILAGTAFFFYRQYTDIKNNPDSVSAEVTKRLVGEVSKLYAIPTDEEPTIAEVKDKEKLKEQAFFANAQNGDYLLIFTKAKTAIIFREKENKIINVGPIALDQNKQPEQSSEKVTVKVINGTTVTGRAAELAGSLSAKLPDLVTVDTSYGDAKTKNVTKTTVIDVNSGKSDAAKKIAEAIGGQVGELPAGEAKPSTDILVISGK